MQLKVSFYNPIVTIFTVFDLFRNLHMEFFTQLITRNILIRGELITYICIQKIQVKHCIFNLSKTVCAALSSLFHSFLSTYQLTSVKRNKNGVDNFNKDNAFQKGKNYTSNE